VYGLASGGILTVKLEATDRNGRGNPAMGLCLA